MNRFPKIMAESRAYFVCFWASLALLFWALPRVPAQVPPLLVVWIWLGLCLPLWQWTLRGLHGTGRVSPLAFFLLLPLNWLGLPFLSSLIVAVRTGEGLGWKMAFRRARRIFLEHFDIVIGLLAAWSLLPYLLASLFAFFVGGCLPYLWGVFDLSLDTKAWVDPSIRALQFLLGALVMPGFHLSLDLLRREYACSREGSELLAALELEYPA